MKVILRKNIESLGQIGDLVDVKEGYGLNYLIPRKYAYIASPGNVKALEEEKQHIERKKVKEVKSAQNIGTELDKVTLSILVQVGEEDKIFGTVTSQMIADALKEKGFDIDKRKIEMPEHINALGIYNVTVKLHSQVNAAIKVNVVKE
ncbi:MAG: 50S ribosomal protein L9 [Chlorobiaceae bacterium]|nr:50S ribosomal protein L9 [Chlorobiaceae bacterium]MBA4309882.1 50S ribosomal protein L9 [Chlorobiaceae bacterium]